MEAAAMAFSVSSVSNSGLVTRSSEVAGSVLD